MLRGATISSRWVDRGWNKVTRDLIRLNGRAIKVGVLSPDAERRHPRTHFRYGDIAMANEYGFPLPGQGPPPPRPFMRVSFDGGTPKYLVLVNQMVARLSAPNTASVDALLDKIGREMLTDLLFVVKNTWGWAQENHPATIARKGFDYPLHETDGLFSLLSYRLARMTTRNGRRTLRVDSAAEQRLQGMSSGEYARGANYIGFARAGSPVGLENAQLARFQTVAEGGSAFQSDPFAGVFDGVED